MNKRPLLILSLLLNAVFAPTLAYLLTSKPACAPVHEISQPVAKPMASIEPPSGAASTQRFHWSQIESSDYPTYVANLRGIGCPEQTVCDIIAADVGALYQPRLRLLRARVAELQSSGPSAQPTLVALAHERDRLLQEETNVVAILLGRGKQTPPSDGPSTPDAAPSVAQDSSTSTPLSAPKMPLIFATTSSVDLGPKQLALIETMRASFLAGLNSDPNSQEYAEYWRQTQPQADHSVKLMLGVAAFQKLQMIANNRAGNVSAQ